MRRHGLRSTIAALALISVTVVTGCGGSDAVTEPPPPPPPHLGAVSLDIVSGDEQSDTVTSMLAAPITVMAYRDAGVSAARAADGVSLQTSEQRVPVAGQVINFVVIDSGCGKPFAGSAATDSTGRALERWELGTAAGECRMEARAVDQETGEAIVYDTAFATVLPGQPVLIRGTYRPLIFAGETFPLAALMEHAEDQYGNAVEVSDLTVTQDAGWPVADGIVTAPTAGGSTFTLTANGLTATSRVEVVPDLNDHTWTLSGECSIVYPSAEAGDSVVWALTVDSVRYRPAIGPTDPGALKYWSPVLITHGGRLWYDAGGSVEMQPIMQMEVGRQYADRLGLVVGRSDEANYEMPRTSDDPVTYEGGSGLCVSLTAFIGSYRAAKLVAQQ